MIVTCATRVLCFQFVDQFEFVHPIFDVVDTPEGRLPIFAGLARPSRTRTILRNGHIVVRIVVSYSRNSEGLEA